MFCLLSQQRLLGISAVAVACLVPVLSACSESAGPPGGAAGSLVLDSVSMPGGLADADYNAPASLFFTTALDPVTVDPGAFTITRAGQQVPVVVSYQPGASVVELRVPFVPNESYRLTVANTLRGAGGSVLAPGAAWAIATRTPRQALVGPTESGYRLSFALDQNGVNHVLHDERASDLLYATCAAACEDGANWNQQVIASGSLFAGSIVADMVGGLHVGYLANSPIQASIAVRYLECQTGCNLQANWLGTQVASTGTATIPVLGIDHQGGVHLVFQSVAQGVPDLDYAKCSATCVDPTNWRTGRIAGLVGDPQIAMAIGDDATIHVVYHDLNGAELRYTTCTLDCTNTGNWKGTVLENVGNVGVVPSLVFSDDGKLHLSYTPINPDALVYASCSLPCDSRGRWEITTVTSVVQGSEQSSLAVSPDGRIHIAFRAALAGGVSRLAYATCIAGCSNPSAWQTGLLDPQAWGFFTVAVPDESGGLRVAYGDPGQGGLKYVQ